jgi:hypothetical protein
LQTWKLRERKASTHCTLFNKCVLKVKNAYKDLKAHIIFFDSASPDLLLEDKVVNNLHSGKTMRKHIKKILEESISNIYLWVVFSSL